MPSPKQMTSNVRMDEKTSQFSKTVLWKLCASLVAALFVAGIIQLYYSTKGWRRMIEEVEQQANWDVAAEYALRLQPLVRDQVNKPDVERVMFALTSTNPKRDFLLLDEQGKVLHSIPYTRELEQLTIDLAPLVRALQISNPELPLYGADPFHENGRTIFSVAPIVIEGKPGYLYMPLWSSFYDVLVRKTGQFYLLRTVLTGIGISAAVAFFVGLALSRHLRRRFRALRNAISSFEAGSYEERSRDASADEIGDLSRSFNRMADIIVADREQLAKKDRLRRELVANISHDLRGPVGSALAYLETLLEFPVSDEERNTFLRIVHENVLQQKNMIDDLFQLSSLEANETPASPDITCTEAIVKAVIRSFEPSADKKSIRLTVESSPALPKVWADAAMIQRVFSNLVSNALRFTPEKGDIRIRLAEEANVVQCSIVDSGIGIPEEDLPHVFESFYRTEAARSTDSTGTGLGLAIVRKLLALHGSTPVIRSSPGNGTEVRFSLPVTALVTSSSLESSRRPGPPLSESTLS